MAIALPGSLIADIRGSVGDVTFQRTHGGLQVRERKMPDETETPARKEARDCYRTLCAAWNDTLTEDQRTAWRLYGKTYLRPARFGGSRPTNGFNCFLRHNAHYCRVNPGIFWSDAPTAAPLPAPWTIAQASSLYQYFEIAVPLQSPDPPTNGDHLYLYRGLAQNPGITRFYGPWFYQGQNTYTIAWNTNPWYWDSPETLVTGQRIWFRLILQNDLTLAISPPTILQCTVVDEIT